MQVYFYVKEHVIPCSIIQKTFVALCKIKLIDMENKIMVNRKNALDWFYKLSLEEQFYKVIKHNSLISGDKTRHPDTLTGSEIELIYNADSKQFNIEECL